MSEYFVWVKAGHILAVIAWMAGLFYLPRLFVYHTRLVVGSDVYEMFCTMERRLLNGIMVPAGIATWAFGLLTAFSGGYLLDVPAWLWLKVVLVALLTIFHVMLAKWQREFAAGTNAHNERFFRMVNEVPTILLIGIVVLAVVRPFGVT